MTTEHYNIVIRSLSFNVSMPPRKRAYDYDKNGSNNSPFLFFERLFNYEYTLVSGAI